MTGKISATQDDPHGYRAKSVVVRQAAQHDGSFLLIESLTIVIRDRFTLFPAIRQTNVCSA